jgi:hypothetical protein
MIAESKALKHSAECKRNKAVASCKHIRRNCPSEDPECARVLSNLIQL